MGSHEYDTLLEETRHTGHPSPVPWVLFVVALLAGGGAAAFLLHRLEAIRSENAKLVEAQAELGALRTSKAELEARVDRLVGEKADLMAAQNELSRSVQAKEDELAKLKSTYDELEEKMKSEISKGEIRLSQADGRLKVGMVDKILFESGEAQISRRGEEVLARVGAILARIEGKQIQVTGHTDDAPISSRLIDRYPTNWELSTSRATNVVRFLQEKAHVPAERLVATGYGPYHPIASNATVAGRARNRRIEILLTPALEPTKLEPAKAPPKTAKAKPAKSAKAKAAKR